MFMGRCYFQHYTFIFSSGFSIDISRNGNGAGLRRVILSHSYPKIYSYFSSRPKPGVGRGMHSYPHFEVIIKISSSARPDPGMCMHLVLPKKRGKKWVTTLQALELSTCVCMYFLTIGIWDLIASKFHMRNMLKWEKEIRKKTTTCCHQITDLLLVWTLKFFGLSCNYNDRNKKDNPKYLIFCPETDKEIPQTKQINIRKKYLKRLLWRKWQ